MKQQGIYPGGQGLKSLLTSSQNDFSDTTGTPRQAPGKPKRKFQLLAQKKSQP
jgi:hypothetical protein